MDGKEYVSGSIKRLRKRLKENPDKVSALKDSVLDTVSLGASDFEHRLRRGEIKINTVADYEKLVKLGLLVSGEATDKLEVTSDIEEIASLDFQLVEDMPEFEQIKQRLFLEMNRKNELE